MIISSEVLLKWIAGVQGGAAQPVYIINPAEIAHDLSYGDSPSLGPFGRLRVSGQGYLVDSTFTYDAQPMLFDQITAGTGTITHDDNLRALYLTTGGVGNGAKAKQVLRFDTPYTPGNGQQIIMTGCLNPDGSADWTGARAEIGYGDDNNGIGFRYDVNGCSVFLRSKISGTVADLALVRQADWNINPSLDVDWSKSQIFMMDFQSLAVGRIRFYLDRDGIAVPVHEILNDNRRVGPYWQSATLPPYWSIENISGSALSARRILAICCTVKNEGGVNLYDLPGFPFAAGRGPTTKTVSTTLVPILSIQLKTVYDSHNNHGIVIPQSLELMTDNPISWRLLLNPTLTGPSWTSVDTESFCNFDVTASAVSGGRATLRGYASGGAANKAGESTRGLTGRSPLAVNNAGVADIMTIAATRIGSQDAAVSAAINWKEIR